MAITDFQVGNGQYALAYGKHLVAGILAGWDATDPNAVKIKVLLGMGEWNAIKELSYDGSILDPATYTFHPGTLSTGSSDPVQGTDPRFPNSIYHNRIAYYTATLPAGLGSQERPDKMRVIAETLKVNNYDASGNVVGYAYSANPADIFADIVRRNCIRLGLNFPEYMDWPSYAAARARYSNSIAVDNGQYTPTKVFVANLSGSGSLTAGTWYYRVSAVGSGTDQSVSSSVKAVSAASGSTNRITWNAVTGATGYRIYFSNSSPTNFTQYFTTTGATFDHTTTSGASSGSPVGLPSGSWAATANEFESNRAFTSTDVLSADALSTVMTDAASKWVRDGKKYRIILPNYSTTSHTFNLDNTTQESYQHSKVPLRERVNQITANWRNMDSKMKEVQDSPANNFAFQNKVGIVNGALNLGPMYSSQMKRISNWLLRDRYGKNRKLTIVGQSDSEHLLPGDLVNVVDRQAGLRTNSSAGGGTGTPFATSLNAVSITGVGSGGWSEKPSPTGRSAALRLKPASGSSSVTGNVSTSVSYAGADYIRVYVKMLAGSGTDEVGLILTTSSGTYSASYRSSPTSGLPGTVVKLGGLPPVGTWFPIIIKPSDLGFGGGSINGIGYFAHGGEVLFSEATYFNATGRVYEIAAIEDKESGSSGDRTFNLTEYYSGAYDVADGFVDPGTPSSTTLPPTFTSLTFGANTVTGGFINQGGSGTIQINRKLGPTGTYSVVGTVSPSASSFTDSPTTSGTYYYKLTQTGVSGASGERSILATISSGATPPSNLAASGTPGAGTLWNIHLSWINHGGTGDIIVERSVNGAAFAAVATLDLSDTSYNDTANAPATIQYRLYNTATTGYSNTASITITTSGGGVGTDPLTVANIWAAYKSDSYSQSNGSNITTAWPDVSGNSRDATVVGTPTFHTAVVNGKPVVRLGADSNDYFLLPSLSGISEATIFIVRRVNDTGTSGGDSFGSSSDINHYPYAATGQIYDASCSTTRKGPFAPASLLTDFHVTVVHSSDGNWDIQMNKALVGSTGTNTAGFATSPKLGFNNFYYMKEDLAAVFIFSRELNTPTTNSILDWIGNQYGISM